MNALMETVRRTETPYGHGAIWWLGQMGQLIKLGNTVLCADYFVSEEPGRQVCPPPDDRGGEDRVHRGFSGVHR